MLWAVRPAVRSFMHEPSDLGQSKLRGEGIFLYFVLFPNLSIAVMIFNPPPPPKKKKKKKKKIRRVLTKKGQKIILTQF